MDTLEKSLRTAKGNVQQELLNIGADWWIKSGKSQGFARSICSSLEATEAHVFDNAEAPGKREGRLTFEINVTQGESYPLRLQSSDCVDWHEHRYV